MNQPFASFLIALVLASAPLLGFSQPQADTRVDTRLLESTAPTWSDLNAEQQELLINMAKRFDSLPAERRQLIANGAAQYLSLNPEQQVRLQKMVKKFRRMRPPEKREKCRRYALTHKQTPFFCEPFLKVK